MRKLLFVAALGATAATILTSSIADAGIPAVRIVALTPDWGIDKIRQSDTYLIATVDGAGHVIRLCGNTSHRCIRRVYPNSEIASPGR
jgi:hypothetical protein